MTEHTSILDGPLPGFICPPSYLESVDVWQKFLASMRRLPSDSFMTPNFVRHAEGGLHCAQVRERREAAEIDGCEE